MNPNQARQWITETLTALLYWSWGYQIVNKNKKIAGVEVDLLVRKFQRGNFVYTLVEVKSRNHTTADAAAISPHQRKRLNRALEGVVQKTGTSAKLEAVLWQPHWPFMQRITLN